ncbi:MAG: HAD family hydrolase [Anaerolineae bacterium]|nr:HAD family hydrolase [Anaerolineae bacterium]MBL6966244.1 HAD family hydrolase [Anaerolineales bacterium]
MSIVRIQQKVFDIDGIIFDKDDTLIEFDALWGPRTSQWVDALAISLALNGNFKNELFSLLGYLPENARTRAESPLAVASLDTLYTLAGGVISRYGPSWHEARSHAISCAQTTLLADFAPTEIVTKGNVAKVMHQLTEAHIRIAIVTSDDRQMTEATLSFLGISDLISVIICGDDPVPNKPAPDALWAISEQLGIEPSRMMMVGDMISDMQFANNAGVAYRVGVASHSDNILALTAQADEIITSIDEIIVEGG